MLGTGRISTQLAGLTAGIAILFIFSSVAHLPVSGSSGSLHPAATPDRTTAERARATAEDKAPGPWHPESSISIPVGELPDGATSDDATGNVFVANWESNNVSLINSTTNVVMKTITVGESPEGMTYVASTGYVYVANVASQNLSVINGATGALVSSIPAGTAPAGVAYDPMNGYLYIAEVASDNVEVLNTTTYHSVTTIPVGNDPVNVAVDDATGFVYVSNFESASVSVINGSSDQVAATIPVGIQPGGIAYDDANGNLYVATEYPTVIHYGAGETNNGNVTVINGTTNHVVALIPVYANPISAAYDPSNGQLYVGNEGSNVTVINGTTNTVLGSQPVGDEPVSLAYDPLNGYVYAANFGTDNVTVIGAIPPLASVAVFPSPAVIPTDGGQLFTTALDCSRGICPAGATYSWALSNSLASLNSSTAPSVQVTAGPETGPVTVSVNVTLNSKTVGFSVLVTIVPGLTSLTMSPSRADISTGAVRVFTVTPVCSAGACPSGVTYRWSLSDDALGSLNFSIWPTVEFQATNTGTLSIDVNATALNQTVGTSAPITVLSPAGPFGLTEADVIYADVGVLAVVAIVIALVARKGRPRSPSSLDASP
jgi:YVTN family beta-propeller protein